MTVKGHASNNIRDITWKNNDLGLVTICNGGTINYWDSSTGAKIMYQHIKNKNTTALFYDHIYDYLLVACDD